MYSIDFLARSSATWGAVINITFFTLFSCDYRSSIRHGNRLLQAYLPRSDVPSEAATALGTDPLQPSSPTPSTRLSLDLLPLRPSIPLQLSVEFVSDECERPTSHEGEFEVGRLFLNRLEVPAAALQQVRELWRMAANAPTGLQ